MVFFGYQASLFLSESLALFGFFYYKYAIAYRRQVWWRSHPDQLVRYGMPRQVGKGDQLKESELIARLQRAGYTRRSLRTKWATIIGRPKD